MQNYQSLKDLVNDYNMGLYTPTELIDQIRFMAEETKETVKYSTVEFICSAGVYFAIQSGECYQIEISIKTTKL